MTDDQDKLPSDAEDADLKPKTRDPKTRDPNTKDWADEATSKPEDNTDEEGPSEQPS